jgi:hypothetical protein
MHGVTTAVQAALVPAITALVAAKADRFLELRSNLSILSART